MGTLAVFNSKILKLTSVLVQELTQNDLSNVPILAMHVRRNMLRVELN
jgi:hypothetical protein